MMKSLLLIAMLLPLISCNGQSSGGNYEPVITEHAYMLGETRVIIEEESYGDMQSPLLVHLHDDESTSLKAAREFLKENGGRLIRIVNKGERIIDFVFGGLKFRIDPNRMFTADGIYGTMKVNGRYSPEAQKEVEGFAARFLELVGETDCIIAVHNNTEGRLSIDSYMENGILRKDAKCASKNKRKDADDFFLVTDSLMYEKLKLKKFNVVWQDNVNAKDDGSLSIWSGKNGRCYVNIETQHGHRSAALRMLRAMTAILKEEKPFSQ